MEVAASSMTVPVPAALPSGKPVFGHVVVIRPDGRDGARFPITKREITFGRDLSCDIRIQLRSVSKSHARLNVDENGRAWLHNVNEATETILNGNAIMNPTVVGHNNVFVISQRSFRLEYPENKISVAAPSLPSKPGHVGVRSENAGDQNAPIMLAQQKPSKRRSSVTPLNASATAAVSNAALTGCDSQSLISETPRRSRRLSGKVTPVPFPTPVRKSFRSMPLPACNLDASASSVSVQMSVEPVSSEVATAATDLQLAGSAEPSSNVPATPSSTGADGALAAASSDPLALPVIGSSQMPTSQPPDNTSAASALPDSRAEGVPPIVTAMDIDPVPSRITAAAEILNTPSTRSSRKSTSKPCTPAISAAALPSQEKGTALPTPMAVELQPSASAIAETTANAASTETSQIRRSSRKSIANIPVTGQQVCAPPAHSASSFPSNAGTTSVPSTPLFSPVRRTKSAPKPFPASVRKILKERIGGHNAEPTKRGSSGIDVVSEAPEEKPLQNNPSRDGIVSQASSHIVSSEAKDDRTGRPSEAHRDASSVQPPALVESLASPSRNGDDAPHGGDQENDTLAQNKGESIDRRSGEALILPTSASAPGLSVDLHEQRPVQSPESTIREAIVPKECVLGPATIPVPSAEQAKHATSDDQATAADVHVPPPVETREPSCGSVLDQSAASMFSRSILTSRSMDRCSESPLPSGASSRLDSFKSLTSPIRSAIRSGAYTLRPVSTATPVVLQSESVAEQTGSDNAPESESVAKQAEAGDDSDPKGSSLQKSLSTPVRNAIREKNYSLRPVRLETIPETEPPPGNVTCLSTPIRKDIHEGNYLLRPVSDVSGASAVDASAIAATIGAPVSDISKSFDQSHASAPGVSPSGIEFGSSAPLVTSLTTPIRSAIKSKNYALRPVARQPCLDNDQTAAVNHRPIKSLTTPIRTAIKAKEYSLRSVSDSIVTESLNNAPELSSVASELSNVAPGEFRSLATPIRTDIREKNYCLRSTSNAPASPDSVPMPSASGIDVPKTSDACQASDSTMQQGANDAVDDSSRTGIKSEDNCLHSVQQPPPCDFHHPSVPEQNLVKSMSTPVRSAIKSKDYSLRPVQQSSCLESEAPRAVEQRHIKSLTTPIRTAIKTRAFSLRSTSGLNADAPEAGPASASEQVTAIDNVAKGSCDDHVIFAHIAVPETQPLAGEVFNEEQDGSMADADAISAAPDRAHVPSEGPSVLQSNAPSASIRARLASDVTCTPIPESGRPQSADDGLAPALTLFQPNVEEVDVQTNEANITMEKDDDAMQTDPLPTVPNPMPVGSITDGSNLHSDDKPCPAVTPPDHSAANVPSCDSDVQSAHCASEHVHTQECLKPRPILDHPPSPAPLRKSLNTPIRHSIRSRDYSLRSVGLRPVREVEEASSIDPNQVDFDLTNSDGADNPHVAAPIASAFHRSLSTPILNDIQTKRYALRSVSDTLPAEADDEAERLYPALSTPLTTLFAKPQTPSRSSEQHQLPRRVLSTPLKAELVQAFWRRSLSGLSNVFQSPLSARSSATPGPADSSAEDLSAIEQPSPSISIDQANTETIREFVKDAVDDAFRHGGEQADAVRCALSQHFGASIEDVPSVLQQSLAAGICTLQADFQGAAGFEETALPEITALLSTPRRSAGQVLVSSLYQGLYDVVHAPADIPVASPTDSASVFNGITRLLMTPGANRPVSDCFEFSPVAFNLPGEGENAAVRTEREPELSSTCDLSGTATSLFSAVTFQTDAATCILPGEFTTTNSLPPVAFDRDPFVDADQAQSLDNLGSVEEHSSKATIEPQPELTPELSTRHRTRKSRVQAQDIDESGSVEHHPARSVGDPQEQSTPETAARGRTRRTRGAKQVVSEPDAVDSTPSDEQQLQAAPGTASRSRSRRTRATVDDPDSDVQPSSRPVGEAQQPSTPESAIRTRTRRGRGQAQAVLDSDRVEEHSRGSVGESVQQSTPETATRSRARRARPEHNTADVPSGDDHTVEVGSKRTRQTGETAGTDNEQQTKRSRSRTVAISQTAPAASGHGESVPLPKKTRGKSRAKPDDLSITSSEGPTRRTRSHPEPDPEAVEETLSASSKKQRRSTRTTGESFAEVESEAAVEEAPIRTRSGRLRAPETPQPVEEPKRGRRRETIADTEGTPAPAPVKASRRTRSSAKDVASDIVVDDMEPVEPDSKPTKARSARSAAARKQESPGRTTRSTRRRA